MRYCTVIIDGYPNWGVVSGDEIELLSSAPFIELKRNGKKIPLKGAHLFEPVQPRKIIAIGLNYKDHITEFGRTEIPSEPVIFLKAPTSVIGPNEPIVLPAQSNQIDYEAELAIVIKKQGRHIPEERANEYIFGYTCLNDVTARDLQKKDTQWARAKSFDSFCPIGPWIVDDLDVSALRIESNVNGQPKQRGNTRDMIFSVAKIVSYVSSVMTLEACDVISTGTPVGVGPIHAGDTVEVFIEGIGSLVNPVIAENKEGL